VPARILIVEDNPGNRELMEYLLRAAGHEVATAENGDTGLLRAARERPDLILLDIEMPVADGHETVEALKRDSELRRIPTIAVTAFAMVGDREQMLREGFDGYLTKPIDPERFVAQVSEYLPVELREAGGKPAGG